MRLFTDITIDSGGEVDGHMFPFYTMTASQATWKLLAKALPEVPFIQRNILAMIDRFKDGRVPVAFDSTELAEIWRAIAHLEFPENGR